MPSFDIVKKTEIANTFRVNSVMSQYDMTVENLSERFEGIFDLPTNWNVGVIVGNSGTGKTTIAKSIFENSYIEQFSYDANAIIDEMPSSKSVREICEMFNAVGFSTPPQFVNPYHVLSNGQKMRVDLAKSLLSDSEVIVFDEFTSVVDRNVAKVGSIAVQKAVRKQDRKFIAVSCHYDIIEYLQPDWIFCTNDMTFQLCDKKKDLTYQLKYGKQQISQCGKFLQSITI